MRNCVIHILYGERGEGGKKWINTANGRAWERRGQRMCLPEYRCRWYHGGGRCYGRCWGWKNWRTRWWSTSSRGTVNSIINDKSSSLVVYYPSIGILRIANEREKRIFHPWSMIYNEKKKKKKNFPQIFSIRFFECIEKDSRRYQNFIGRRFFRDRENLILI